MTLAVNIAQSGANNVSFRNRIINGAMVIDQRNAGASQTVTTAGAYTVDRFFVQPTGASITTQRVAGANGYQYALRLTGAASVTQCFTQQKIEQLNSYDLAGQTVTVSFTASSSTLTSLTCYVEYATAGADNWGTFTTSTTQAITINSTATRYSFQSTLSASATNGIRFIFATGAFTSGTLDITGVQLEAGTTASPFEYRPFTTEVQLCQRYFCKSSSLNVVATNGTAYSTAGMFSSGVVSAYSANVGYAQWIAFPVTMRTEPATFTIINTNLPASPTAGYWSIYNPGIAWVNGSLAAQSYTANGVGFSINGTFAAGPVMFYGAWAASAEL
jgi:hypothetical protein